LLATEATSLATYPGADGLIAYTASKTARPARHPHIVGVLPDGTSRRKLTPDPIYEQSPAWSADGRRLAFVKGLPHRAGQQVWTMGADGSDATQVTHQRSFVYGPSFSPDGRRLVYSSDWSHHILKIRSDGTHRGRWIVNGRYLQDPSYSPSGARIVFAGAPEGHSPGIWTVRPDGTDLNRLTPAERPPSYCNETPTGSCWGELDPDYSPDGRHVAFSRCNYDDAINVDSCDVYLIRTNGTDLHSIWHADDTRVSGLSYSPAGDRIAVSIWPQDYSLDAVGSSVYTMTPTGADIRRVTVSQHGVWASEPSWQPIPGP
jgi:Tol biopolymer transport system component